MRLWFVGVCLAGCTMGSGALQLPVTSGEPDLGADLAGVVVPDPDLGVATDLAPVTTPGLPSVSLVSPPELGEPPAVPSFARSTVDAGPLVESIAVGDIDGDGVDDFVTANRNDFVQLATSEVETASYLRSRGDGTFDSQLKYEVPLYPENIALGDLDGDGNIDVLIDSGTSFQARLRSGSGFGAPVTYVDHTNGASAFAIADIDGDGRLDVVASESGTGTLVVRRGHGDGTFGDPIVSPCSGGEPSYLVLGDFDQDGRADVAYASQSALAFGIALGRADGTFLAASAYSIPHAGYPTSLAVGDVDADGHPDLALVRWRDGVVVALGDGHGALRSATTYAGGTDSETARFADLDGDGHLDLLLTDNSQGGSLLWFPGMGGGWLAPAQTVVDGLTEPALGLATGDFDQDGKVDVLIGTSTASVWLLDKRLLP